MKFKAYDHNGDFVKDIFARTAGDAARKVKPLLPQGGRLEHHNRPLVYLGKANDNTIYFNNGVGFTRGSL